MTYYDIVDRLRRAGIEAAEYEAGCLICHFENLSPAALMLCRDRRFDSPELREALRRRTDERYPLQYLIGEWGFCGETYKVTPDCLIPRPDTELLVERAVELLPKDAYFVDVGCGSGCIAISVLARRPDTHATALDISEAAVGLARLNAARCGVADRLDFIIGDMQDAAVRLSAGEPDGVLSNPPYIPSGEVGGLAPELAYEPLSALDGGEDGLDFYRCLVFEWSKSVKKGGLMLFETGVGQTASVAAIAQRQGFFSEIFYDIEHRDRVIRINI